MAFFYYCFFGMMFSDAGYGLIMFLATLFILLKCKPEGQKRKTVMMYMYCGISTMFWGIMFGSFFGDIINIVGTISSDCRKYGCMRGLTRRSS